MGEVGRGDRERSYDDRETPRATHVALAVWRACVAYLVIITATAIPSLDVGIASNLT